MDCFDKSINVLSILSKSISIASFTTIIGVPAGIIGANYIHKNELDKACFQHGIAYEDFKYLARRTASDKILRDKAFNIARSHKYDGYQRGLASMVYKFFDKKSTGSGIVNNNNNNNNNEIKHNLPLGKELHKPIIRKLKKRKVYSGFRDNIWGADLTDMQLITRFKKGYRFLLCVIDIFNNILELFL